MFMMADTTSLSDRYLKRRGRILVSGVQALVRLMLVQADRDREAGLHTAGFVSGYRGSPLGTLDTAFAAVADLTAARGIVVKPAVNEEMAATAVAGSQQIAQTTDARVDGVYALWYGKGPGLDRAADAIRHGNYQGSSPKGGVVLAVGDDHIAKSSSIVCYSDEMVAGLQVPLFYPADAGEIVVYGLHGFALSRHTGSWAALKIITEVADAGRVTPANEMAIAMNLPEIAQPPTGLHNRWPEMPLEQEARQQNYRLPGVLGYVRANGLDQIKLKASNAHIGIVSAGKSWLDLREALRLLDLDDARLEALGIALYKPAMIWPVEPERLMEFSEGLDSLVIVEEKGPFIERQVKSLLYGRSDSPAVWGKRGPVADVLFPAIGDLTPELIAARLGAFLSDAIGDAALAGAAGRAARLIDDQNMFAVPPAVRSPFFCSGCPHNRSTVLPEGSRATAGIGCHGLAAYNRPATASFAQMGGEGVHWMGLSPFTAEAHVFANMGDGTYFHSGLLAIRQAVAANLNITYKLLYNSAVAMTGGQSVDGELSVLRVLEQLRAEGVKKIIVSTDDPARYAATDPVRAKADRIEHRDDIDALQRELRAEQGVSVIIYEQMCATEKRRLRKRGKLDDPARRVFINELVCEGCGDCSVKSNCLSVEPTGTEFGTKRKINQSSCNKDYSCVTGFCPSFVTVDGGALKKTSGMGGLATMPPLPDPGAPAESPHQRILVAGIGGTGVVTIGALLSMAAHMNGRAAAVLDQVGMAQKGGAVTSHIHIADDPITALRIPTGEANLVLACDQIVGNARDVMAAISPGRTYVVANADVSITGEFTQDRDAVADPNLLARRLSQRAGQDRFIAHPFTRMAERLFGDTIGSNLMMTGLAYQKGWVEIDLAAFYGAIDLNGAATTMNKAAFAWGRRLAIDSLAVYRAAGLADPEPQTLDQIIDRRAAFLREYQNDAYSVRYRAAVARVRAAEARVSASSSLTEAAARALFKLMAYKDEYEVARLYSHGDFTKALMEQFEGSVKLSFHLAPPILAGRDKTTGHLRKRRFGSWIRVPFRLLASLRGLRGTAFDLFGRSEERKIERALVTDYEALLEYFVVNLTMDRLAEAVEIAALPMAIRGYGHVKVRAVKEYKEKLETRLAAFECSAPILQQVLGHSR